MNQTERLRDVVLRDARMIRPLAAALVVLGCIGTGGLWVSTALQHQKEDTDRFVAFSQARQDLFQQHMGRVEDVLRSFEGLFLASDEVSLQEFQRHFEVLQIQSNLPEVLQIRFHQEDETGRIHPGARDLVSNTVQGNFPENVEFSHATSPQSDGISGVQISSPVMLGSGHRGVLLRSGQIGISPRQPLPMKGRLSLWVDVDVLLGKVLPDGVGAQYRVQLIDAGAVSAAAAKGSPVTKPTLLWDNQHAGMSFLPVDVAGVLGDSPTRVGGDIAVRRWVLPVGDRLWVLSFYRVQESWLFNQQALLGLALSGGLMLLLTMAVYAVRVRVARAVEAVSRLGQQAQADDARLQGVLAQSTEGIITFDAHGQILASNPAAQAMFRREAQQMRGLSVAELVDPQDREGLMTQLSEGLNASGDPNAPSISRVSLQGRRTNGALFPLAMSFCQLQHVEATGERIAVLRDMSVSARAAEALKKLAQHDALTGLLNREAFQQQLALELETRLHALDTAPTAIRVALLIIDLDRFKKINETLGHFAGDCLLLEIGGRLRTLIGEGVTLARLGGDEFGVLLTQVTDIAMVEAMARRILKVISDPMEMDGQSVRVSASIGIASVGTEAGVDDIVLLSQADSAMYLAKSAGRSQYHVHQREDKTPSARQLQLEVDLYRAIDKNELVLFFQPQFECATRRLVGAEALLRWRHGVHGMVSPAEFIPLAEESGLIVPIGRWVLDEACRQAKLWQAQCPWPVSVAVNLASRQMVEDDMVSVVQQALRQHQLAPTLLELEITESAAVTDTEQAKGLLQRLADIGVGVSIDDFGVGYSSLAYLRDLPIQRFKIDRSFLSNVPHDPGSSRLVSTMVSMARSLEVGLVAEGVETEEQLAFLVDQGCDKAQGFLLGKPMPGDEFLRRLAQCGPVVSVPVSPVLAQVDEVVTTGA